MFFFGLFLSIESFRSGSFCIIVVSDSETALLALENLCLKRMFLFCSFRLFLVCLFDLIYPLVCLCNVITRSYLLILNKQLCDMIVCLLPKLSFDIRFRMMDAIFEG